MIFTERRGYLPSGDYRKLYFSLLGQGSPETAQFSIVTDQDGNATLQPFPHPFQKTVMPVVSVWGDVAAAVGTCFAVTNQGLALTAAHVVKHALGIDHASQLNNVVSYPDRRLSVLYIGDDHGDTVAGGLLPVHSVSWNDSLDICALHVVLPEDTTTGELIRMPVMPLDPNLPQVGDFCIGIGYHEMEWNQDEGGTKILQSLSARRGDVVSIRYPKVDSSLMPFPCFEVSQEFEPGMSGGPVIGPRGIIGLVCSGKFASLIAPGFGTVMEFDVGRTFILEGLKKLLVPHSVGLNGAFTFEQSETDLVISYGLEPRLRFLNTPSDPAVLARYQLLPGQA